MKDKIKVVFICHFSTEAMRKHLPLSKRRLYSLVRKLMHLPGKGNGYADIASWDANFIKLAKECDNIDLHVISAHSGLRKRLFSFEEDGIPYHFVKCDFATFLKYIINDDDKWIRNNPMTPIVHKLVEKIKPDIVVLAGAENAYYSSTVLGLLDYPVFVFCQTVYNNPKFIDKDSKNATTERRIFEQVKYCAVYCKEHYDLLRELGYNGNVSFFRWPSMSMPIIEAPTEKKYDFVNFAFHMSLEKGYHDSIRALSIVKQKYPNVKLNLIDGGTDVVREEIKSLINELGLQDNVLFTPFFKERNDLFKHIQNARFAVLPCKVDYISGTMLQSMYYHLPIVVYKTTGTTTFNENRESALIADMENIEDLARNMLILMDDPAKAEEIKINGRKIVDERIEQDKKMMEMMHEYMKAIIANYREGTPIPKALSFENDNPDK